MTEDSDERVARMASMKLGEGDVRGAVRALCSTAGLVHCSEASFSLLCDLHPHAPADRREAPHSAIAPLSPSSAGILAAVRSFPGGSAGGADGLRPQHL